MNRKPILILAIALTIPLCIVKEGLAQDTFSDSAGSGLFGPRVYGRPLQPPAQKMVGGILLNPSGSFIGIGRPQGGTMFGSALRTAFAPAEPGLPSVPEQPRAIRSPEVVRRPEAVQWPTPVQPEAVSQPARTVPPSDRWLRVPGPEPTSGRTGSRNGAPLTATSASESPRPAPSRLTVGFAPGLPPGDSAAALTALLHRSADTRKRSLISVTVQGETAHLRGVVATDQDRAVAELVVLMEPSIWRVQNDLVVERQPSSSQGVSAR
jgi:hypothetical protein